MPLLGCGVFIRKSPNTEPGLVNLRRRYLECLEFEKLLDLIRRAAWPLRVPQKREDSSNDDNLRARRTHKPS